MNRPLAAASLLVALLINSPASADKVAVIVANQFQGTLELDQIARIFLGKRTHFPDGTSAIPLNLDPKDPAYAAFARQVLKKSTNQLRAYWAKRIFTGKGKPPQAFKSEQEVRELVASNNHFVAYIKAEEVDESVRPIIIFEY